MKPSALDRDGARRPAGGSIAYTPPRPLRAAVCCRPFRDIGTSHDKYICCGCQRFFCLAALTLTDARAATYGGIALGRANVDTGMRPVPTTGSFFGPPGTLTVDDMSIDDHDTAYAAFFGVQITRYFGAEIGYWNHGTFQSRTTSADTGEPRYQRDLSGRARSVTPSPTGSRTPGGLGFSRATFAVHGAGTARATPSSLPIVLPVPILTTLAVPYAMPDDETGTVPERRREPATPPRRWKRASVTASAI